MRSVYRKRLGAVARLARVTPRFFRGEAVVSFLGKLAGGAETASAVGGDAGCCVTSNVFFASAILGNRSGMI